MQNITFYHPSSKPPVCPIQLDNSPLPCSPPNLQLRFDSAFSHNLQSPTDIRVRGTCKIWQQTTPLSYTDNLKIRQAMKVVIATWTMMTTFRPSRRWSVTMHLLVLQSYATLSRNQRYVPVQESQFLINHALVSLVVNQSFMEHKVRHCISIAKNRQLIIKKQTFYFQK